MNTSNESNARNKGTGLGPSATELQVRTEHIRSHGLILHSAESKMKL